MLLLYCISKNGGEMSALDVRGVGDSPVIYQEQDGIRCYFSEGFQSGESPSSSDALRFWEVINTLFQSQAIIPLRYPTLVKDEKELRDLLTSFQREYVRDLDRLRGMVQLKIVIEHGPSESDTPGSSSSVTGTQYLRQKQRVTHVLSDVAHKILSIAASLVHESKQSHKNDSTILFLFLPRASVVPFRETLSAFKDFPGSISVSGPWPPSEFVNCHPEISPANVPVNVE